MEFYGAGSPMTHTPMTPQHSVTNFQHAFGPHHWTNEAMVPSVAWHDNDLGA